MAMFDWVKAGSGSPIMYGGATILVPPVQNGFYTDSARDITYIQPSGATPSYFVTLNNKFQIGASGWNA